MRTPLEPGALRLLVDLRSARVRASLLATGLAVASCSSEDGSLPPPPPSFTGPVTGGASGGSTGETGGELGDLPGCDPLLDPLIACGPGMACELETLTCVEHDGTGAVDEACTSTEECSAGLVCVEGRCRVLCDPEGDLDTCEPGTVCADAAAPIPGVCRESCSLVDQVCSVAEDACNLVSGVGGALEAACTDNPGAGQSGDACSEDSECLPGFLCTASELHTLPCTGGAARCCAPVCDPLLLPCVGLEPVCTELGIPGQGSAGYCGAA